jgi:hypothetical protein
MSFLFGINVNKKNSFSKNLNKIFFSKKPKWKILLFYFDDSLVWSISWNDHQLNLYRQLVDYFTYKWIIKRWSYENLSHWPHPNKPFNRICPSVVVAVIVAVIVATLMWLAVISSDFRYGRSESLEENGELFLFAQTEQKVELIV